MKKFNRSNAGRVMRNALIIFLLGSGIWFSGISASIAVPQYINYQGVLRDAAGNLQTGNNFQMTFKIYNAETNGTAVLTNGPKTVVVNHGIYNVTFEATPTIFNGDDRWLEVTVNSDAMTPRLKINSVAYSIRAGSAEAADYAKTAGTAANALLLSGIATSDTSAARVIPVTNGSGKIDSSFITGGSSITPEYAVTAGHAASAETATTATNALSLEGHSIGFNAGNIPTLDASGTLSISKTSTSPIISGINNNSGTGVYGKSNTGTGVSAESTHGTALDINGAIHAGPYSGSNGLPGSHINAVFGTATLTAFDTVETIYNDFVTPNSIIFISPRIDGSVGTVPIKVGKISSQSFTITPYDESTGPNISMLIDYLIINH